jgi:RNA polymerase sigma-70 factor (ECF subfamily)
LPYPDAIEERLAALARDEGRTAILQLFWLLAPRIQAYAAAMGAGEREANAMVIETLMTLKRRAGHFNPDQISAATFVFRCMRDWRIALCRGESRPTPLWEDRNLVSDPLPRPAAAGLREGARRLPVLLDELPGTERQLLIRAFCRDLSHTALARQENLPLAVVKSAMRSVVTKLQVLWRELR